MNADFPNITPDDLMRIAEGDTKAFARFYHHYYQQLLPFLRRYALSAEDAEELIQQTMLRAWLHRDKLPGLENLKGWVFRVASREYQNYVRNHVARAIRVQSLDTDAEEGVPVIDHTISIGELRLLIAQSLVTLSPQRRQVFELSRQHHLSIAEIAERLTLSPKTVKNTLTAALQHVRDYLAANGYRVSILLILGLIR